MSSVVFQMGINQEAPKSLAMGDMPEVPRAVAMLANTSAIAEPWHKINHKFRLMYAKQAFVHSYLAEGMEEMEFTEAKEDLKALEMDYREIASDNADDDINEV